MYHCDPDRLARQIDAVFAAWGMPAAPRRDAVAIMAETDLRGIDSHGIAMLPGYDRHRAAKRVVFDAPLTRVLDLPVVSLFDGGGALGHHASVVAMDTAIAAAQRSGLAAAGVRNSQHFGAAGLYAERAALQGLVGLAFTNVANQFLVPTNGAQPMFGTNPIAFAAPARRHRPFLLDMATTTVAMGKLNIAVLNHRPLPPGWALDAAGGSLTDSVAAFEAKLLTPLGGTYQTGSHKGYGLAAMVEILCATLTGAAYGPTREQTHPGAALPNIGHFFMAIDPRAFRPDGGFQDDLDRMIDALHAARPADPAVPVMVAGEREYRTRAQRLQDGIPVPDDLRDQVADICRASGAEYLLG